jgi:glutaminase
MTTYTHTHIQTVDGQTFVHGNDKDYLTLQGCVWPFIYCQALQELGEQKVSSIVGSEALTQASGPFLNANNKPHNPFIPTGALTISSVLYPKLDPIPKIVATLELLSKFSGHHVGNSMPAYLSALQMNSSDIALAYYLVRKRKLL